MTTGGNTFETSVEDDDRPEDTEHRMDGGNEEPQTETGQKLRRSTTERRAPIEWWKNAERERERVVTNVAISDEPTILAEALAGPDSEKWHKAMQEDYDSIMKNQTWTLLKYHRMLCDGCCWGRSFRGRSPTVFYVIA